MEGRDGWTRQDDSAKIGREERMSGFEFKSTFLRVGRKNAGQGKRWVKRRLLVIRRRDGQGGTLSIMEVRAKKGKANAAPFGGSVERSRSSVRQRQRQRQQLRQSK